MAGITKFIPFWNNYSDETETITEDYLITNKTDVQSEQKKERSEEKK